MGSAQSGRLSFSCLLSNPQRTSPRASKVPGCGDSKRGCLKDSSTQLLRPVNINTSLAHGQRRRAPGSKTRTYRREKWISKSAHQSIQTRGIITERVSVVVRLVTTELLALPRQQKKKKKLKVVLKAAELRSSLKSKGCHTSQVNGGVV